jgi:D-alanyl-D-alanine dipeptidase
MVWREFRNQAAQVGVPLDAFRDHEDLAAREPELYERLAATVFMFWGVPSDDPRTPPPHSTGAAIDLSLQDEAGVEVDMGCPIDEATERAWPNYYAEADAPELRSIHAARQLLNDAMASAGFVRHGNEWWHFSLGDQMAALAKGEPFAIYGAAPALGMRAAPGSSVR